MKPFKLEKEPKIESGFKIPENYFENFSATLTDKLTQESIVKEGKVISIFRKRKTILFAVAAILVLALIIPILYTSDSKSTNLDSATIENYLAEETHLNQEELIQEINPNNDIIIADSKEIETQTLEDILVSNPNIENIVIEN